MEKIFSIDDLKNNNIVGDYAIIIPEWILDKIIGLCFKDKEYVGQLILLENIVEYVFITGIGNEGSVFPKKKIVFNDNSKYRTIEFHTHTDSLGEYWVDKFSTGDINTFSNRVVQDGDGYQHMLFTTNNVLTWGNEYAPDVRIGFGNTDVVIANFKLFNQKHKSWSFK